MVVWLDSSERAKALRQAFPRGVDWLTGEGVDSFGEGSMILVHWSDASFEKEDEGVDDAVRRFRAALRVSVASCPRLIVYSGEGFRHVKATRKAVLSRIARFPEGQILVVTEKVDRGAGCDALLRIFGTYMDAKDQSAAEAKAIEGERGREEAAAEALIKEVLAWLVLAKSEMAGLSADLADLTERLQREIGEAGEGLSQLPNIDAMRLADLRKTCEAEPGDGGKSFVQQCLEKWQKAGLAGL
jgi:hypothetical protein